MALTLTETLDNLYTTTWQNMKSEAIDNVFNATPFWFWMKDHGKLKTVEGGRWIGEPLIFDDNDNVQWIAKGGTVPLNDYEFITTAKYDWKYLTASMVRFFVDDQQNRGKNAIMNFMNAKLENTKNSLIKALETALGQNQASMTSTTIGSLDWLVPENPTTSQAAAGFVGGIDQSAAAYSYWRSQGNATASTTYGGVEMSSDSFATYGPRTMRYMLNICSNNLTTDKPDIIVCGQTAYEFYEDMFDAKRQIIDTRLADAGFQSISFKGIPMIWSPSIQTDRMYFLNTRFLYFVYDPYAFFDMTEWKPIPDQVNDRAAQIVTACAFITNRRRCHGVIYNIDTP